jgi:hypothetical protein
MLALRELAPFLLPVEVVLKPPYLTTTKASPVEGPRLILFGKRVINAPVMLAAHNGFHLAPSLSIQM